jgi:hypothetical protein
MHRSFEVNMMVDQKAVSSFTRSFRLAFSLMMIVSGGLIFVVGYQRSNNPYLPVELIAIMIGGLGNGALFLLERRRKHTKEVE